MGNKNSDRFTAGDATCGNHAQLGGEIIECFFGPRQVLHLSADMWELSVAA